MKLKVGDGKVDVFASPEDNPTLSVPSLCEGGPIRAAMPGGGVQKLATGQFTNGGDICGCWPNAGTSADIIKESLNSGFKNMAKIPSQRKIPLPT